ncbi:retrovirus-related pol polyprotein from transposon TNT 1-94 [Tanacetum coccineum]
MQKNLTLIAKYFKKIYKPINNNLKTSSNSRSKNVDTSLRYKNDNQIGQFGNQRTVTVVGAMETVGSQVVQQTRIQCFNCKEFGHFAKECSKPKKVKDYTYHKEKMLLCKQAENGVPLQAEQADWLADMDDEIDEQELEAHYNYMAKIRKKVDSNVIPDSPDMCDNDIQTDQNAEERDDERVALANLIANLKLDVNENKRIQKQLKKANTSLAHELKEYKSILAETSRTLGYVESLEKEIDELESDKVKFTNMYDILLQDCVSNDVMCSYLHSLSDLDAHTELQCLYLHKVKEFECLAQNLSKQTETVSKEVYTELLRRVSHKTNVSIPPPRSTQMKEKVMPNNSQVKLKKTEVEDHYKISSISKKTKSVTACNDSLKSRTSNVNAVCATCGKCVFNSNHDACVYKFLNDVNARTKKPNVVPISTRKPKSQANKSVATPPKKAVSSDSTVQNSKSYYRMLYENTSKACKWWIEQQCPSGYKWVLKTKMKWVPKVRNETVQKRVSFSIDNASRITNVLKITNTVGSNLSCIPSSSNSLVYCSTYPLHC